MVRRGWRYKDMAREMRGRGLDVEESDVLAVVAGKREPDAAFKTAGLESSVRAEQIPLEGFAALARALK